MSSYIRQLVPIIVVLCCLKICFCNNIWRQEFRHTPGSPPQFWMPINNRMPSSVEELAFGSSQHSFAEDAFFFPNDILHNSPMDEPIYFPAENSGGMHLEPMQIEAPVMRHRPNFQPIPDVDEHMGHEEIFSFSPHVIGSGYQNQPSYEDVPKLSKQDISRYASIYKYDWQANERSSLDSSPEESISPLPSFPSLYQTVVSRIEATAEENRKLKPLLERQVLVTRKLDTGKMLFGPSLSKNDTPLTVTEAPTTASVATTTTSTTTVGTTSIPMTTTQVATTARNANMKGSSTANSLPAKSTQVPVESIKDMMKSLKRRPMKLFENKLAELRNRRLKSLSNHLRGKPKKRLFKFTN